MRKILNIAVLGWMTGLGGNAAARTQAIGFAPVEVLDERGNGGDGVVCVDKDGNKTVEALDLFEGRGRYRFQIDMGPGQTYLDKVKYVLDRLAIVDPLRSGWYWEKAKTFEVNALFWPGIELVDIPD